MFLILAGKEAVMIGDTRCEHESAAHVRFVCHLNRIQET